VNDNVDSAKARKAQTVRMVISRRERAPRSPKMERALKRLIWRYVGRTTEGREDDYVQE
jgi:hypothetical protein